jgi:hypothetical protein
MARPKKYPDELIERGVALDASDRSPISPPISAGFPQLVGARV